MRRQIVTKRRNPKLNNVELSAACRIWPRLLLLSAPFAPHARQGSIRTLPVHDSQLELCSAPPPPLSLGFYLTTNLTMFPSHRYNYKSLQHQREIRLLHLYPATKLADVQLSITHTLLDEKPAYEALSYTWGDLSKSRSVLCGEASGTLSITQNCDAALRRLRWKNKKRTLWIDAICINQENVPERNHQVQLMTAIYRQAERVLAYLGEAFDDSDVGMDFVSEHAAFLTTSPSAPSVGLGPGITSSPQQRAIDRILERPYFERVWILQEIECATEVEIIIGGKSVDWRAFSRAVFYVDVNKKLHLGSSYHGSIPTVVFYHDISRVEKPGTLLQFLNDTRHCKSSDPRDKVYALLAMTPEAKEQTLIPNYFFPCRDLFISLAKFFITREKNLDVLCHVQATTCIDNLPSWVPDWSSPRMSRVLGYPKTTGRYYKAAHGPPAMVDFSQHDEILTAWGKAVDTISQVGPTYEMGTGTSITTLRQWYAIAQTVDHDQMGRDKQTAFLETLIASPPYSTINPFVLLHSAAWRLLILDEQSPNEEPLDQYQSSAATIFQEQVNKACNGRRLFVTAKGHTGLGPVEVQEENLVAVLLGGQVPFVLCRRNEHFSLVGECYVYGLMNGEAVEDPDIEMSGFSIR